MELYGGTFLHSVPKILETPYNVSLLVEMVWSHSSVEARGQLVFKRSDSKPTFGHCPNLKINSMPLYGVLFSDM